MKDGSVTELVTLEQKSLRLGDFTLKPLKTIRAQDFYFYFLYPLYCTTYNTAHAASRLWRYSSIYMNPLGSLTCTSSYVLVVYKPPN